MLVVHPRDITTSVLSQLYNGIDSKVIDQDTSKREIEHLLHHCPPSERMKALNDKPSWLTNFNYENFYYL